MKDLGKNLFHRSFSFSSFNAYRLIINPRRRGYPALFLICEQTEGEEFFILGMSFVQFNHFLMKHLPNQERLLIAERMTDFFLGGAKTEEIELEEILGKPWFIQQTHIKTRVRKFIMEPETGDEPVYFFQIIDFQSRKAT
jgi:hypothetical protein